MSGLNNLHFGKVAVLAGGNSRERDISLQSGKAVLDALVSAGINATCIDTQNLDLQLLKECDRAFIALHGIGGEDGTIQALLEFLEIPYTGSGVKASAIAMDKILSKRLWKVAGLPLADSFVVNDLDHAIQACEKLGYPVIFKPSLEGSSVGITRVESVNDVSEAFNAANIKNQQVLVEKFIEGKEFSVGILGDEILPSVHLATKRAFYDFQAKYIDDDTEYFCPSGLNDFEEKEIQGLGLTAFNELSCSGWGRVDFIQDSEGKFYILEVNTSPGLTSHSLVPMGAKQAGYNFEELIIKILQACDSGIISDALIEKNI